MYLLHYYVGVGCPHPGSPTSLLSRYHLLGQISGSPLFDISMTTKEEIISYFNSEHYVSLYDLLAYYGGIPLKVSDPKHTVELVDINLRQLTLNYVKGDRPKTTVIDLSPPLKSLGQAQGRLQQMAFEAADALRVSPYQITTYTSPAPSGIITMIAIASGLAMSASPNTSFQLLRHRTPRLAAFVKRNIRKITFGLLAVHLWEYFYFLRPRLDKFRVYGILRLKWFLDCLFEGFPSWLRFYAMCDDLNKQRQAISRQHS